MKEENYIEIKKLVDDIELVTLDKINNIYKLNKDESFRVEYYSELLKKFCSNIANKELFVHVGLPKTKTSSLQEYCYENFELLKKKGVYYPKECILNRHQAFLNSLVVL